MTKTLCLRNRQRTCAIDLRLLRRITRTVLEKYFRLGEYELCLHLVAAAEMAHINWKFLRHEGSTDVITFDQATEVDAKRLRGEIFISLDDAVAQARQFCTTWQSELVRYVIHGLLHLRGHDDLSVLARRKMKREENRLLKLLASHFNLAALRKKNSKPQTRNLKRRSA